MIHERLQRARKSSGISLREAASAAGVSHTAVSKWEKGDLTPSSVQLLKLARAYGVRTEYFFRPVSVQLRGVEYRKQASVLKKLLNRVEGDVTEQAERWQELISLFPERPVPSFAVPEALPATIDSAEQLEIAAEVLRHEWDLGLDPIADLIDLLESRGILVIRTAVDETGKIDGLAGQVDSAPFVVVASQQPGDRQRLTLAHELAHLVLEGRVTPSLLREIAPSKSAEAAEEVICHRFAAAFILPRPSIISALGARRPSLEWRELHILKHEYGLSMQASIFRARDAGIISAAVHERLFKAFSARGWRKKEPGEVFPAETTILFEQLVYRALGQGLIGESKAAELLGTSLSTFHKQRMLDSCGDPPRQ